MKYIEYFTVSQTLKDQTTKIIDDAFSQNEKANVIINKIVTNSNNLKEDKLKFNYGKFEPGSQIKSSDYVADGFANFLEIGNWSDINANLTSKLNFFYFDGSQEKDITLNANIQNQEYEDIFDINQLTKKFKDNKFNFIEIKDITINGSINIDIPRTTDVVFISNAKYVPKQTEASGSTFSLSGLKLPIPENKINLSSPALIIIHNTTIKFTIKYWAPKYEITQGIKQECPVVSCPKTECAATQGIKQECPVVSCPKTECVPTQCAKQECPVVSCPKTECAPTQCATNSNYMYYGIISVLTIILILFVYLYISKNNE